MRIAVMVFLAGVALVLTGMGCGGSGGGAPPVVTPTSNWSLRFDGVDDMAIATGVYAINTFTIEAWVKPTTVTANGLFRGIAGRPASFLLSMDDANNGQWLLTQCSGPCDAANSPVGDLSAGGWEHLAAVYDGSMLHIYRNGVLVASNPKTGDTTNMAEIWFGRWNGTFHGRIDEVRFWDVPRLQPQIAADMGSILTGTEPGLIGYWRFEEGAGQISADSSPTGNAAQLGTTGGADADDPVWQNEGAPVS